MLQSHVFFFPSCFPTLARHMIIDTYDYDNRYLCFPTLARHMN